MRQWGPHVRSSNGWTARRVILAPREDARVIPDERVIEINRRRAPDPLPDSTWGRLCAQADAMLAGRAADATLCRPLMGPDPRDPGAGGWGETGVDSHAG